MKNRKGGELGKSRMTEVKRQYMKKKKVREEKEKNENN